MPSKPTIIIVGGGPAAMMLGCTLDTEKCNVTIYEQNASLGRKFLVAGKGGFNLTHAEEIEAFKNRYTPSNFVAPFIQQFTNVNFIQWLATLGITTYVGTSRRVFPTKDIKPIAVLNAIKNKLIANNVTIHYNHTWQGFNNANELQFLTNGTNITVNATYVVFALGGGSWQVTGSNATWHNYFSQKKINVLPFIPSNCGYTINWDINLLKLIEGTPIKNSTFSCGTSCRKGEAIITSYGVEGSGIYPLSTAIRVQLQQTGTAQLYLNFKPDLTLEQIQQRLTGSKLSMKDKLQKLLNLSATQVALLKHITTKETYTNPEYLSKLITTYPLLITDTTTLDEAISTVGGIALDELTTDLELTKLPHHYCLGEMLNWDAPTGGYLLQANFSMGYSLAKHLNEKITK